MSTYQKLILVLLIVVLTPFSFASHNKIWDNSVEFGGSMVTGNSPETTLTGKIASERYVDFPCSYWGYALSLEGRKSTARGVENARFFQTDVEGRYLFSPKTYSYIKTNYVYNAFDTYDMVVRDSIGIGWIILRDDVQKLTIEGGPGSTHQRIAGPETWQSQFIGHTEANYVRHLSETAEFEQFISADVGDINAHYQFVSAIKTNVLSHVALRFSFEANHYTKIPSDTTNKKSTDTATNIMFIYTM